MGTNTSFEFADKFGFASPFSTATSGSGTRERKWAESFVIEIKDIVDFINKNKNAKVQFNYLDFDKSFNKMMTKGGTSFRDPQHNVFLQLELNVNEGDDAIDFTKVPFFKMEYDQDKRLFNYSLLWEYENVKVRLADQRFAIEIRSSNFVHFSYLLDIVEKELTNYGKESIIKDFTTAMDNAAKIPEALKVLYEQAPQFVVAKRGDAKLWYDLKILLDYDDKGFWSFLKDSSSAVVNLLRGFADMKFLYQIFLASPKLVKRMYSDMNNNSVVDETEMPNRTIFASLLTAICYTNFDVLQFSGKTFHIGKTFRPDSNLMSSHDTDPEKIFLAQQQLVTRQVTKALVSGIAGAQHTEYYKVAQTSFEPVDAGNYFAPLEMVTLVYEETGQQVLVPAIFVKDIADQLEWAEIMKNLRVGIDILVIVLSLATLLTGPGGFMFLLSVTDLAMASTDLYIAGIEDELSKTPDGRAFLSLWNDINLAVAAANLPFLIKNIFSLGAKLLLTTGDKVRKFITTVLTKIILERNIARFTGVALKVVEPEVAMLGMSITSTKNLYNAGVVFATGQLKSDAYIVAIYKGATIAEGTEQEVKVLLKNLVGLSGEEMIEALDKLIPKWKFTHIPTSGVYITEAMPKGSYLVGGWRSDFKFLLGELDYPKISDVTLLSKGYEFPLPSGQKFNLLNVTDDIVKYFSKKGGFFNRVNAKWVDAAVVREEKIFLITEKAGLYKYPLIDGKRAKVLTGFGKEVHRFEWKHGYRFDPETKMMVPPQKATDLQPLTKFEDYKIEN